ncbi:MAG: 1-(5-phosphoribosyl)-5-[(5-phosphoribosylamino)methylideneamino]imidazole-4-carboxamide isomerase [Armatimonadetes bacterium]|nr:1-(5-phosphoribosyl)-5-[(5-phosphoribosylamino)methylideneamino]imidazole-4-carboxamide isomerase [Armatimonadota bacterium]
MVVIPAIDISEGRVVRLRRGRMQEKTVYSGDPAAVARRWAEAGAEIIHVIDLDGAVSGRPVNLQALRAIVDAVDVPIQFGGGLRTVEAIETVISAGAEWAILGTAALADRALLDESLSRWGERIIVAVDARDGKVAIEGWAETTGVDAAEFAAEMGRIGVQRLLCTDIARDGMLSGPNIAGLRRIAMATTAKVIASGGVRCVDDILALRAIEPVGIIAVVVGRALYEGTVDLAEAIRVAGGDVGSSAT